MKCLNLVLIQEGFVDCSQQQQQQQQTAAQVAAQAAAASLAEFNQATSKGHEILSQVGNRITLHEPNMQNGSPDSQRYPLNIKLIDTVGR